MGGGDYGVEHDLATNFHYPNIFMRLQTFGILTRLEARIPEHP